MNMPGSILAGAGDRLLPASVPFQFFLAACVFHPLAWGALIIGADELPYFTGGPGYVLVAIHLLTLGVLAMSAIGASFQLLPVVTLRPLRTIWPARLCFWIFVPAIVVLCHGMAINHAMFLNLGAILVVAALLIFMLLTSDNLRRAGNVAVVAAHGWGAMVSLVVLSVLGLLLAFDFELGILEDHQLYAVIHMSVASFGFMGLFVIGFSLVLVPMFALSGSLSHGMSRWQLILVGGALLASCAAMLIASVAMLAVALIIGMAGVAIHLYLMRHALRTGMRKRLGLSFLLVRSSWAMLVVGVLLGMTIIAEFPIPNQQALFGFIILAGWLLTFLTGILQRIMPFLASMHAAGSSGMPAMMSDLASDTPLKVHFICHFAALALCSVGIVFELTEAILAGAAIGLFGAIAFLTFGFSVWLGLKKKSDRPEAQTS